MFEFGHSSFIPCAKFSSWDYQCKCTIRIAYFALFLAIYTDLFTVWINLLEQSFQWIGDFARLLSNVFTLDEGGVD